MPEGPVTRARAALARGDVLIAYDEAITALEADAEDLDARFLAALALARAGVIERARVAATELLARIDEAANVPISLLEDADALVARLAKDEALAATGTDRNTRLSQAADLYEAVARKFGRYYTAINAATLALLAGDHDRATTLAKWTRALVDESRRAEPADDYWRVATTAEAALILNDVAGARQALARASTIAGDDYAAIAVTRRQLRLVCAATDIDETILSDLSLPLVLHYCGHLIDPTDDRRRFPADQEDHVQREISAFLDGRPVGFAYGSLASGADILAVEALLDRGVRVEVVLPFDTDEFEKVSVAPAGPEWTRRFRSCLARVSAVVHASDSSYMDDDELFGYAARIAMGHALNHAAFLDARAEQLPVWNRSGEPGVAGTSHDVTVWNAAGNPTHVIALPAPTAPSASAAPSASTRRIGAILFTDLRGFSRLRDEQFPIFIREVHAALAAVLKAGGDRVLWANAWGDAISAAFSDVIAGAECAIGFHETLTHIDLEAVGLPADLNLRVGAHAGPVMGIVDPVTERMTYWGRELTRAARIEPRTPEGEVYVTDAFAALLALEPNAPFVTEYVGRVTTAKDFETIPMYRLQRRA